MEIAMLQSVHRVGVIAVCLCGFAPFALADPVGLWRGSDGSLTEIVGCGTAMCGYLASMNPRNDPATGQPWVDKKNPDPRKRARPLVGVEVLNSMAPSGRGRWSGQLYNFDDGRTYRGNLIEVDGKTIRVEGCVLFLCGGENLHRVPTNDPAVSSSPAPKDNHLTAEQQSQLEPP